MKKLLFSVLLLRGMTAMAQDTMMEDDRTADRDMFSALQRKVCEHECGIRGHCGWQPVEVDVTSLLHDL